MSSGQDTALGIARARFVEGLQRRARELKGAVALLAGTPDADRPREEMRRRLHALYASAQVFRIDPLAGALQEAITRLDAARDEGRAVTQDDLDALGHLAATLPGLAGSSGSEPARASVSSRVPPPRRQKTLLGMAPSGGEAAAEPPAKTKVPVFKPPPVAPAAKRTVESAAPAAEPAEAVTSSPAPVARPAVAPKPPSPSDGAEPPASPPPQASPPPPSPPPPAFRSPFPSTPPPASVVSVLVLGSIEEQARIRAALAPDHFEIIVTTEPEVAERLARTAAPDVIVASRDLARSGEVDLLSKLSEDPLTDFIPVVMTAPARDFDAVALRESGAREALSEPVDGRALARAIGRLTDTQHDEHAAPEPIGDATVEELADRIAQEVRRGLVESLEGARDLRIPLGEGAEVLAAAWSTVGRVRAELAQRSGGRLHFHDDPRHGPALLSLVADDGSELAQDVSEVSLNGRRIVVADDDPAVVWFFAGLLREEGARVEETGNGREALAAARRFHPDVVISDILMPQMDGLSLCRELQRDPGLAEVPVILLSWKEDYLQRMRELQSGARGYLRKEAGSSQILNQVRQVLLPRARLEARLRAGGEVRGRVESVGAASLLRSVAAVRPDARVTVRDGWNLFEMDLRGGGLVGITRTATDGAFSRGEVAMPLLVGVTAGRYSVAEADAPVRTTLDGALDEVLARGAQRLGAILDSVSPSALSKVAKVGFEEGALDVLLGAATPKERAAVQRLQRGERPRDLMLEAGGASEMLAAVLEDLARRGAITEVRGVDGEDRIAEAMAVRGVTPPLARPSIPPAPAASPAEPEAAAESAEVAPQEESESAAEPSEASAEAEPAVTEQPEGDSLRPPRPEADHARETPELDMPFGEAVAAGPPLPPPSSMPVEPPSEVAAPVVAEEAAAEAEEASTEAEEAEGEEAPVAAGPLGSAGAVAGEQAGRPGWIGWTALVLAVAAVAVGAVLLWRSTRSSPPAIAPVEPSANHAMRPEPGAGTAAPPVRTPPPSPVRSKTLAEELAYGKTLPSIDPSAGVAVGEGQGLLEVRAGDAPAGVRIRIDGRPAGAPPLARALPSGRHELEFRRGAEVSYRYLYLQAGHTRIVTPP